jgi:hypothetical protein
LAPRLGEARDPAGHPLLLAEVDATDGHALKVHVDGKPDVVAQLLYRRVLEVHVCGTPVSGRQIYERRR